MNAEETIFFVMQLVLLLVCGVVIAPTRPEGSRNLNKSKLTHYVRTLHSVTNYNRSSFWEHPKLITES